MPRRRPRIAAAENFVRGLAGMPTLRPPTQWVTGVGIPSAEAFGGGTVTLTAEGGAAIAAGGNVTLRVVDVELTAELGAKLRDLLQRHEAQAAGRFGVGFTITHIVTGSEWAGLAGGLVAGGTAVWQGMRRSQ